MFFIIETVLIFLISIQIASMTSAGLLTLFFGTKSIFQRMTKDKWGKYFNKIGPNGLLLRMYICFFITLLMIAFTNTIVFWHNISAYGIALMVAGLFHLSFRYRLNKEKFIRLKDMDDKK